MKSLHLRIITTVFDVVGLTGILIVFFVFLVDIGIDKVLIGKDVELGLVDMRGIVQDSRGNIYCPLQLYNRVQVYSSTGKFKFGFFLEQDGLFHKSFQGDFILRMGDLDSLEAITSRKLLRYNLDGTIVSSRPIKYEYYRSLENGSWGDNPNGDMFRVSTSPNPKIYKRIGDEKYELFVELPFYKWAFTSFNLAILLLVICFAGKWTLHKLLNVAQIVETPKASR